MNKKDLFESITREHILNAIQEIDEKGVRKGRNSSTYDLIRNGKSYPPKLVLSIAHRLANGRELDPNEFEGGQGTPAFEFLTEEGFEIVKKQDPITSLVERYKSHLEINQLKDELYKWEIVKEFKGCPDLSAENFYEEVKRIPYGNLIYPMGRAVLLHMLKEKPEKVRVLFKYLFNESIDLGDRIKYFDSESLKLYRSIGEKRSHHQDERSIATYLTVYNPSKYTFYKNSFYQRLCKLFGVKPAKKNDKYVHYLQLLGLFIKDYIEPDKDLLNRVSNYVPEQLDSGNRRLLAQDILYQMLDKKDETSYCIFQGTPQVFDLRECLKNNDLASWMVKAHKDKIAPGDKVILWLSGKEAGCYALAEVQSEIYHGRDEEKERKYYVDQGQHEDEDRVKIIVTHNLVNHPVLWEDIKGLPEFENFKAGNQGTNFSSSEEEYQTILELVEGEDDKYFEVKRNLDPDKLEAFLDTLRLLIRRNGLTPEDKRITFNVRCGGNKLVFIIGNRYAFMISGIKDKTSFSFISGNILTEDYGQFKDYQGNLTDTYWNMIPEIDEYKIEVVKGCERELERGHSTPFRRYNSSDFSREVFEGLKENKMKNIQSRLPLNQILYGPPGTGKTYNTINMALDICGVDLSGLTREEVKERYNEKVKSGQIVFTTFHQSMSYEDFIEGIKPLEPEEEGGQVIYKVVDGIFKKACIEAAFNYAKEYLSAQTENQLDFSLTYDQFVEQIQEELTLENSENKVALRTKSGGKVFVDNITSQGNILVKHMDGARTYTVSKARLSKLQKAISDLDEVNNINDTFREIIGGSNASAYWAVLNAIRDRVKNHGTHDKELTQKVYLWEDKKEVVNTLDLEVFKGKKAKPVVIIIDEINRGNIASIFGDLITLLEPDKRLGQTEELSSYLPYSKERFGVPPNVYVIGTMNTADRSVEALDTALRRRFSFQEIMPDPEKLRGKTIGPIDLEQLLTVINQRIELLVDRDHTIGHSYFMNIKQDSLVDVASVFNDKILPLLQEYFYGDFGKIGLVLGKGFIQKNNNKNAQFAEFEYENQEDFKNDTYSLKRMNEDNILEALEMLLRNKKAEEEV
jgi:5-methylcytosine-specific restriction protein B